jgi:predicted alpha/beta-hydrolase family hydrolase
VIEQFGSKNLIIGGKSMGGRIASLVADETGVAGLECLG